MLGKHCLLLKLLKGLMALQHRQKNKTFYQTSGEPLLHVQGRPVSENRRKKIKNLSIQETFSFILPVHGRRLGKGKTTIIHSIMMEKI